MDPNNPWAQPPYANPPEADEAALFEAVGRALTSWEHLEAALATLFVRFIAYDRESLAARRAYGSVVSFMGRAEMLTEAASAYFSFHPDEQLSDSFRRVSNACRQAAARRNDIAHGSVVEVYFVGKVPGYALAPGSYNVRRVDLHSKPAYLYSVREIAKFTKGFDDLYLSAIGLAAQLLKPPPTHP